MYCMYRESPKPVFISLYSLYKNRGENIYNTAVLLIKTLINFICDVSVSYSQIALVQNLEQSCWNCIVCFLFICLMKPC